MEERWLHSALPGYAQLYLESINAFYKIGIFSVFSLSALLSICFTRSAFTLEYLHSKFPYLEMRLPFGIRTLAFLFALSYPAAEGRRKPTKITEIQELLDSCKYSRVGKPLSLSVLLLTASISMRYRSLRQDQGLSDFSPTLKA